MTSRPALRTAGRCGGGPWGVRPEERRRGIGRALMAHAVTAAGARCEHVVLDPTPDSAPFFGGLGFTMQGWPPGRSFYLPAG